MIKHLNYAINVVMKVTNTVRKTLLIFIFLKKKRES